jgi:hypothetical protein
VVAVAHELDGEVFEQRTLSRTAKPISPLSATPAQRITVSSVILGVRPMTNNLQRGECLVKESRDEP